MKKNTIQTPINIVHRNGSFRSQRRDQTALGNGPNTQPFVLQVTDGFGIRLQCRRSPQLDTAFHGGGKAGVDPLPDYPALELRDCHQHSELKIASRVLLRSVDSLAAGDQRDFQPVEFIQDQGQMRQAASQSIQFVDDQTPDSTSADVLQQSVKFGAGGLGSGNLVGITITSTHTLMMAITSYRIRCRGIWFGESMTIWVNGMQRTPRSSLGSKAGVRGAGSLLRNV